MVLILFVDRIFKTIAVLGSSASFYLHEFGYSIFLLFSIEIVQSPEHGLIGGHCVVELANAHFNVFFVENLFEFEFERPIGKIIRLLSD